MSIHGVPRGDVFAPGIHARENLSRNFSELLLKYAKGNQLTSFEVEYLKEVNTLFDEFAFLSGDRSLLTKETFYDIFKDLHQSNSLAFYTHTALVRAAAEVTGDLSESARLRRITEYRTVINDLVTKKTVSLKQAEELGRFFDTYNKCIKGY